MISLTTIPSRVRHIEPCIESLLLQELPVLLWIPIHVERTGNTFDGHIPDFLKHTSIQVRIVPDQGPITKLLPALREGHEAIVTVDDDVTYGKGWASHLLEALNEHECVVGYRGRIIGSGSYNTSRLVIDPPGPREVDLITGTWGRAVRSEFFKESINEEWKQCPLNDDIAVDAHLRRNSVRRVVVKRPCAIRPYRVHKIHSLWTENKGQNDDMLRRVGW